MTISLPPDLASFVESQVQSGAYDSAAAVLRAAVRSLEQQTRRDRQEVRLRQLLEDAADEVERGESVDIDHAFDEVEVKLFGQKLDQE